MSVSRRKFIASATGALFASSSASSHSLDSEGNTHTHPHVPSHTPIHFPAFQGIEHTFLLEEFRKYATMRGCWMVIEHGMNVRHPALRRLASFVEHVPFYVNSGNPIRELNQRQIRGILLGQVRNWKEVGGLDVKIELISHGRNRWKRAFATMLAYNFLQNDEYSIDNALNLLGEPSPSQRLELGETLQRSQIQVAWEDDYEAVAAESLGKIGSLAVSLRPIYARGLFPLMVDGFSPLNFNYPIWVDSHINVRIDREETRNAASELVADLVQKYDADKVALEANFS